MKKLISLILVFSVLLSGMCISVSAEETTIKEENISSEAAMASGYISFGKRYSNQMDINQEDGYYIKIDEACEIEIVFTGNTMDVDAMYFGIPSASSKQTGATYNSKDAYRHIHRFTKSYLLSPGVYYLKITTGKVMKMQYEFTVNQYEHFHDYSYYVKSVAPTCTEGGYQRYQCKCGQVLKMPDGTAALGHTEVTISGKKATCTQTGLTDGKKCNVCGEVTVAQKTTATIAHTEKTVNGKKATCVSTGLTEGKKCSVCGTVTVAQKTIPATGIHIYSNNSDTTCNVCGHIREAVKSVPMYRMYDPNGGEHFYTGSTVERDNLVAAGWNYEGVGFNFPVAGDPVHRLYHKPTGEHLYTMSEEEKAALLSSGWTYEGVAFNSAGKDEVPQYRLQNPNETRGAYHFTGSTVERDHLISLGWEYQGIGWYSCVK